MKVVFEHQHAPNGKGYLVKQYVQTNFTSPFHLHDLYELIWIKKSYGKLYAGENILNFKEGDIYFFAPGLGHCFYNEKSFIALGEKAHAVAIFFPENFLGDNFFEHSEFLRIKELLVKSKHGLHITAPSAEIEKLFSEIHAQKGMEQLISLLQLLHNVSKLPPSSLKLINESAFTIKINASDSSRLDPVIKYIMENFTTQVESSTAARMIHMAEAAFCRYFKRHTEHTFSQFVNNVRITHATSLLLSKNWDILRICYESGFSNLSYFNRQFREITGQSPKEYRSLFQNKTENLIMDSKTD
jgi:AraC-like DNA-binding protein